MKNNNFFSKIIPFIKARYAPRGSRISFSQDGEDMIMNNVLKKLSVSKPFYIDIGAHHPVFGNNTYLFYKMGGRGVLVEPNSLMCNKLRSKRPRDICLNAGAGKLNGEEDFFVFSRSTRSTFSKDQANEWENLSREKPTLQKKKVISLDTIINSYCGDNNIDIVSIDAEGLDLDILSGFSWTKRPKIFCVESNNEVENLMERNSYKLVAKVFYNSIFVDNNI
jgi:FkbM family methyltransferase